jgi:hypothetical protein
MASNLQVVFVSHDGMFFKVDTTDLTVAPFANIVQYVHKIHVDETSAYFMVKISQLILGHIFSRSNLQYEIMKMSFFDALNIILVMTEIDRTSCVCEEDNSSQPNPVDDFLASLTEDDVSTSMMMDADMYMIDIEE